MVPYAGEHGNADAAGLLLAAAAAGMFAGNFVVGRWIRPDLRERLTLPLAMLTGAPPCSSRSGRARRRRAR